MTDIELAWAAGLFEGEGHVGIKRNKARKPTHRDVFLLRVAVAMTDREAVMFFQERWPGHLHERHHAAIFNARSQTRWEVCSRKAEVFLRDIEPFLRTPRVQEKVRLALEFQGQKLGPGAGSYADAEYHDLQRQWSERFHGLNATGAAAA